MGRRRADPTFVDLPEERVQALFAHELLFPSSTSIEQVSQLRSSIDAGMAARADQLFDMLYCDHLARFQRLRELMRVSPDSSIASCIQTSQLTQLQKSIWDDLIYLDLFRSATAPDTESRKDFLLHANKLAQSMIKSQNTVTEQSGDPLSQPFEPAADVLTGAALLSGFAQCVSFLLLMRSS